MWFLGLFWGMTGGWWAVKMTCTCLGDFGWEVKMRKIGVTIERRIYL